MTFDDVVNAALEIPILPSFTKIGYHVRRRVGDWQPLDSYDLSGETMLVTGATSGIGRAAAEQLAGCGAAVIVVGRNAARNQAAVAEIVAAAGAHPSMVSSMACDLGDFDQVRALADKVLAERDRLDVLIHNAGALSAERREAPSGIEATVASQVVGPFLLTSLLLDRLGDATPGRVITMSSGGMYTAGLSVAGLQMPADTYKGAEQYARAKRAQVTLNEMWAERCGDPTGSAGVSFHAMHPGWADTPGVADALPTFGKIMGPLLRSPEQGADTLVWLAADDEPLRHNGAFWLDRHRQSIHKLPTTKRTDTAERRDRLWRWVATAAGV